MAKKTKDTRQRDMLAVLILSLLLGLGGGYVLGNLNSSTDTSNNMEMMDEMFEATHSHDTKFEVSANGAPTVEVKVTEDGKSGYNVKLMTTNFRFSPDSVNKVNVIGEGHAHLYVDGEKVGRLYGPDYHYDENFEGTKTFRVTLNANDHSEYAVNGQVISSEVEVTHNSDSADHNHN